MTTIDELHIASGLLGTALERYLAACSAVVDHCTLGQTFGRTSLVVSDAILEELRLAKGYRAKIQTITATITRTRNSVFPIVPISILPPDVLTSIFELVVGMQPNYFETTSPLKSFDTKYPEALTHVCSRWRQIALGSRGLWTRIDIPFKDRRVAPEAGLIARASAFAARADPSPLDIRLVDPGDHSFFYRSKDDHINAYCSTIATRVRYLRMTSSSTFERHQTEVLDAIFKNCIPGELKELVVQGDASPYRRDTNIIEPLDERKGSMNSQWLEVPNKQLQDCLHSVKVLRLTGVFFRWNSRVYHGLVELQLFPTKHSNLSISESQLAGILTASPRLRLLSFGLGHLEPLPDISSRSSVQLDDLEVLNLGFMDKREYKVLFRVISPGPKPLQLSLDLPPRDFLALKTSIEGFLSRSRIQKLHIRVRAYDTNSYARLSLFDLFTRLPDLEILALTGVGIGADSNDLLIQGSYLPTTEPRLDVLHLVRCRIDLEYLRKVTELAPIRRMTVAHCSAHSNARSKKFKEAEEYKNEISSVVPVVDYFSLSGIDESNRDKAGDTWDPWSQGSDLDV